MLVLFVSGHPRPQGSKRHVGGGRMVEASPDLPVWRSRVAWQVHAAARAGGWVRTSGPVSVELRFVMPPAKAARAHLGRAEGSVWHQVRPDVDKLARAVLDALVEADVIPDDSVVAELLAVKVLGGTAADVESGVWITVRPLQ